MVRNGRRDTTDRPAATPYYFYVGFRVDGSQRDTNPGKTSAVRRRVSSSSAVRIQ